MTFDASLFKRWDVVTVDGAEFQGFVISLDPANNMAVVQDQTDMTLQAVGIDQIAGTLSPRSA